MAREARAVITREAVRVPEGLILRPSPVPIELPVPMFPELPLRYNTLVLNIETTGIKPWESRIICISYMDVLDPAAEPVVIMHEDEKMILYEFLLRFKAGNYQTVIGYNLSFDFRYLIAKSMFYGLGCKDFFECFTVDMMRAMKYGKTDYLWGDQPSGKLTEWSDWLFGDPKPFTDVDMVRLWLNGRWEEVKVFAVGQIRRTFNLWRLWTYVTSLSTQVGGGASLAAPVSSASPTTPARGAGNREVIRPCASCMAEVTIPAGQNCTTCPICKAEVCRC